MIEIFNFHCFWIKIRASERLICLPIPFGPVLNRTGPKGQI